MTKQLISIIVPVYKVERELPRCVRSLIGQTYKHIEIILIDDGSPDQCPSMCDEYARKDNRIKVIHKKHGGLSDARNCGLLAANGEYILYVDSDDYIELNTCDQFLNGIDVNADFIIGECREIHKNFVKYQKHVNLIDKKTYLARDYVIHSIKQNEWYAPVCFNLYKKSFLLKNSLFFKKNIYFEDIEILPRLFLSAHTVQYRKFIFYNYVVRSGSIIKSKTSNKKIRDSLENYAEWFRIFLNINDKELQRYLNGALVKYYLSSCRNFGIKKWAIPYFDYHFSLKYSLNLKEQIKVIFFNFFPSFYVRC